MKNYYCISVLITILSLPLIMITLDEPISAFIIIGLLLILTGFISQVYSWNLGKGYKNLIKRTISTIYGFGTIASGSILLVIEFAAVYERNIPSFNYNMNSTTYLVCIFIGLSLTGFLTNLAYGISQATTEKKNQQNIKGGK